MMWTAIALNWIRQNWMAVSLATAIALLLAYGSVMKIQRDHARAKLQEERAEWDQEKARAEAARQAVIERSNRTLEETNETHARLLAQAESNAVRNYLARHGRRDPGTPGGGIFNGLRAPGTAATGPGIADRSEGTHGAGAECLAAPDAEFIRDAAADAATIAAWQAWAKGNKLPVEGDQAPR